MKSIMRFTRAQNSCLPSIILMILLNSVSRGTRLAEDFLNASRSHRLPRWRISPPGTRVLSSRIVFTSISCSICLRSDLRYGDLFVRNPWDRAHGNKNPRCRSGHIIHLACYIFYILDICRLPLGNQMYIFYVQRWPPSSLPCLESYLIFARGDFAIATTGKTC